LGYYCSLPVLPPPPPTPPASQFLQELRKYQGLGKLVCLPFLTAVRMGGFSLGEPIPSAVESIIVTCHMQFWHFWDFWSILCDSVTVSFKRKIQQRVVGGWGVGCGVILVPRPSTSALLTGRRQKAQDRPDPLRGLYPLPGT
jgi:hypothetical protein